MNGRAPSGAVESAHALAILLAACTAAGNDVRIPASDLPGCHSIGNAAPLDEVKVLGDKTLQKALRLSRKQLEHIKAAAAANERDRIEMRAALARIRFASLAAREAFVRRFADRASDRIRAVLTMSQLETYACRVPSVAPDD